MRNETPAGGALTPEQIEALVETSEAYEFNSSRWHVETLRRLVLATVAAVNVQPRAAEVYEQQLTEAERDFVGLVRIYPGRKLNSGEAEGPNGEQLWKRPESLGLIKCVGSYKWVPADAEKADVQPKAAEGDDARELVERLKFELRQAMIDYGSAERANDPDRIRETSTRGVTLIDSLAPISKVQPKGTESKRFTDWFRRDYMKGKEPTNAQAHAAASAWVAALQAPAPAHDRKAQALALCHALEEQPGSQYQTAAVLAAFKVYRAFESIEKHGEIRQWVFDVAAPCAAVGAEPVRYPHPDEDDPVTLWKEIRRLRAAMSQAKCDCTAYCGQYVLHGSCRAHPAPVTISHVPVQHKEGA